MAGSVIQAIREEFQPELKFASRVLHNRTDQFLDCFARNTHTPLRWNDVAHIIKPDISKQSLRDLRLYLQNQTSELIGRHAIDINTSFFEAVRDFRDPLIVIDNYMDISSKLLEDKARKRKGFLNWNALDCEKMLDAFIVSDYITPASYVENLKEMLLYFRFLSPDAKIILVQFPSEVALNNDRQSVVNSRDINKLLKHEAADISEQFNVIIHQARAATEDDLDHPSDWSHYRKQYYRDIASNVIQDIRVINEYTQKKPVLIDIKNRRATANSEQESLSKTQFSVSVVIQFFQDFDHIRDVLETASWADEIIINDGPFTFATPVFEYILEKEEDYRRISEVFFKRLAASLGANIVYKYGTYKDEREKRIFGYNEAVSDIVLSIDADEVLDIHKEDLRHFIKSDALVGMFECVNLTFHSMCIAKPMPLLSGPYPYKPFAFKKHLVDSERHLDYLWLVGTKQAKTSTSEYYLEPICKGLHFTNVRSAKGAAVKFGFYTALSWKENPEGPRHGPFADCSYYFKSANGFSNELKHEILANALPAGIGFPEGFSLSLFEERKSPLLARIAETKISSFTPVTITDSASQSLLPGIPLYLHVESFESLAIYCDHSLPVQIILHYYLMGKSAEQTKISGEPHSFRIDKDQEHLINLTLLEPRTGSDKAEARDNFGIFRLLQVCCWAGDELKEKIRKAGIPVQMSFHLCSR